MALWPFAKKKPELDEALSPPAPGTLGVEDFHRYLSQPLAREQTPAKPKPAELDSFMSDAAMAQAFTSAPAPAAKPQPKPHAAPGAPAPPRPARPGAAQAAQPPADPELAAAYAQHNGAHFLAPTDLAVAPLSLRRIAMIGSCFLGSFNFQKTNPTSTPIDMYLANNVASLEELPATEDGLPAYDFQVVQLGLRFVLPDATLWRLPYSDIAAHEAALARARQQIDFQLKLRMKWNIQHGLLTFVVNFLCPQRNPMGALFPRFDLRNPEYFVQKLNEHLQSAVAAYTNAYILDLDRLATSLGRRYAQDDVLINMSHNSTFGMRPEITGRIEPIARMVDHFDVRWPREFPRAVWAEMIAMYRTVRQADQVKLVVVDLDDTLWTGVIGEMTDIDADILDGWQLGLAEALLWLKKRGILLAIISKNDESRIRDIWPSVFGDNLRLEDFAAIRINWQPKAENMGQILAGVNLLPRSVVFIDDNPAERSAMQQAFPDMRILGRFPYYIRQTLLWAPETQVIAVTEESGRRTEMVQAQLEREQHRQEFSADDFLRAAAPVVTLRPLTSTTDPRFARAQELVNKTNQFNTTGRRWAAADWAAFFRNGGHMQCFDVKDAYTAYGLVGVVLIRGTSIEQWVMSCRVLGYEIENAVMAVIVAAMRAAGAARPTGQLCETDANFPCRTLFAKNGFIKEGDAWVLPEGESPAVPEHVSMKAA
jgi:FkbH-like protein